ncbi:FecCD family ABC transporter permease [Microbacterium saperdae]|uniref:Iron complex transport system permease protein n=1 Tax=Microbacterium saperdae TaxID=69368 RepID=A0A543BIH7_9MICO|nr:iron ABC transporter permease [Microbacterium saperdae]TQL84626.1 iron complex transport system permease protein [Microbacterium saperdae]GGM61799.1 iron ABC transporter permease [Microbacterium saperdae]
MTDALLPLLVRERRRDRTRSALVCLVLSVAILAFAAAEILAGSADIALDDMIPAAFGQGEGLAAYVVFETRVPRALVALLSGALFGLAGHLYQRLVGNVLATPDILGISAGASAAATAVLTLGAVGIGVQVSAVVGAVGVAALVFLLSWHRGVSPYRLVLVGIGIGACASAVTTYLVTRADEMSVERALRWMIGSLSGADWAGVWVLLLTLAVGAVLLLFASRGLRTFALGDDLAAALGTRVSRLRFGSLLLGAGLAAVATSITGPIGFVALVAGPLAARLVRRTDAAVAAALVGAVIVVAADLIAQTAPFISPVPTGSITAVIGAPALIYLLVHGRRRS